MSFFFRVAHCFIIEWIYHQVESFYEPSHHRKHFYKYLCSVKKVKDETDYCLRLLPIGGFVQMAGEEIEVDEDEDDNEDDEDSKSSKKSKKSVEKEKPRRTRTP